MQVDGISVAAAEAISDGLVASAYINPSHHLILVLKDGTQMDCGAVVDPNSPASFYIDANGHLISVSQDETESDLGEVGDLNSPASFYIDANGHLISVSRDENESDLGFTKPKSKLIFTSSGTLHKSSYPGATRFSFQIWGAGGGGASGGIRTSFGGGGGGYLEVEVPSTLVPESCEIVVGVGGAGGVGGVAGVGGQTGTAGGKSTVALLMPRQYPAGSTIEHKIGAGGGGAGAMVASGQTGSPDLSGGVGGYNTRPTINELRSVGLPVSGSDATPTVSGVDAPGSDNLGVGGVGLSSGVIVNASGILSLLGGDGGGRGGSSGSIALPGCIPGGGGSGGRLEGNPGADGARGEVRVTVYYD